MHMKNHGKLLGMIVPRPLYDDHRTIKSSFSVFRVYFLFKPAR